MAENECENHLQRSANKKTFVEQTPYWLLHKLADEKRDQDCQFDPQHECSKTDLCLTEYCIVCISKNGLKIMETLKPECRENELKSLNNFLKNKKVDQEAQLTSLVQDRGINDAIIYLRGACHKTSITSNDLLLINSHLKLLDEYKSYLQKLVRPYWLLHKLASEKIDQDCQFDPQHECSKTNLCLTEYCIVCAAKKWMEDCGNT